MLELATGQVPSIYNSVRKYKFFFKQLQPKCRKNDFTPQYLCLFPYIITKKPKKNDNGYNPNRSIALNKKSKPTLLRGLAFAKYKMKLVLFSISF